MPLLSFIVVITAVVVFTTINNKAGGQLVVSLGQPHRMDIIAYVYFQVCERKPVCEVEKCVRSRCSKKVVRTLLAVNRDAYSHRPLKLCARSSAVR
jgi:hypothetical protein